MIDLTGQRFSRWTVTELAVSDGLKSKWDSNWKCRCDCGNEKIVPYRSLVRGSSRSCGCLRFELMKATFAEKRKPVERKRTPVNAVFYNPLDMRAGR